MKTIKYVDENGEEQVHEKDEVTHKPGFVVAYDNTDGVTGVREKVRVPVNRVVEVDG